MASDLKQFHAKQMEDPDYAEEWNRLEPEYQIIKLLIEARTECGLTQEELAQRCGLKQSNISRIERGTNLPSLRTLWQIARGLDKKLEIRFV